MNMHVLKKIESKLGALIRLLTNKFYDFLLIKNINTLGKDIKALYTWSTTTQSIDYLYLKSSLKAIDIRKEDVILDLGSGKGRIVLFLNFKYKLRKIIGAEINIDAFNISKELTKNKLNIELHNINVFDTDLIFDNKVNKIILFNPFNEEMFEYFIKFLLKDSKHYIEFIYLNISQEQIDIAQKIGIKYKIIEIDKPFIGIYKKVNLVGYLNE